VTLFVYGTLMRGGRNHTALAGQRFLGAARTPPGFALLDLGHYPGLVRRADGRGVRGELYEVAADCLGVLDEIEGAPALFRLEPLDLEDFLGSVYAYFYQPNPAGVPLYAGERWGAGPEGSRG
jgi:gamma-glutamylaminecyclotransferase